jgi:hypothetical protein
VSAFQVGASEWALQIDAHCCTFLLNPIAAAATTTAVAAVSAAITAPAAKPTSLVVSSEAARDWGSAAPLPASASRPRRYGLAWR